MNEIRKDAPAAQHSFVVQERAHVEIRGMTEVISFDENTVTLATTGGNMCIEGSELRVNVLDVKEGTVMVDGHIDSIGYTDIAASGTSRGFFERLLH